MPHLVLLLALYPALVLQSAFGASASLQNATPQFLLLVAVAALLAIPDATALLWAAVAGFGCDAIAPGPLGITMFFAVLIGAVIHRWTVRRTDWPVIVRVFWCAVFVFGVVALSGCTRQIVHEHAIPSLSTIGHALRAAGTTSGIAFCALLIARFCQATLIAFGFQRSLARF